MLGRRWGKTTGCVELCLELAMRNPGYRIGWFAHVVKGVRIGWEHLEQRVPDKAIRRKLQSERSLYLWNGSILFFQSLEDPDSARGEGYDLMVIDEGAFVSQYARDTVIGPMAADRGGKILVPTTPKGKKGRGGWVFRDWQMARQGAPGYFELQGPTTDNPIPWVREWCEWYKGNVDERVYRQEILAEFLDAAMVLFDLEPVCTEGGTIQQPVRLPYVREWNPDEEVCVAGLDLADTTNWSVLSVLGKTTGRMYGADRFQKMGWHAQIERIVKFCLRFCRKPQREEGLPPVEARTLHLFVDVTGLGGPVVQMLHREIAGLPISITPVTFDNDNKQIMVDSMSLALEKAQIAMPYIREYVSECETLEEQVLPSGVHRYKAPPGLHDDCVWSLALATLAKRRVIEGTIL